MSTNTPSGNDQVNMDAIKNLIPAQEHITWCVMPFPEELAHGVPLFGYFRGDEFTYTGVPAVDGLTPVTPELCTKFGSPMPMADMSMLVADLADSAEVVRDNVMAYLAHRRLEKPGVPDDQIHRVDPQAGYLSSKFGHVPAVVIATQGESIAALYIDINKRGALMRMSWLRADQFTHDVSEFNQLSSHLDLGHFLSRMHSQKEEMAINAVDVLLKDSRRVIPELLLLAYLFSLMEPLSHDDISFSRASQLVGSIQDRFGDDMNAEKVSHYVSSMCMVRGILPLFVRTRIPGSEAGYERTASKKEWADLYAAVVHSLTLLVVMDGVDRNATELTISNALHRLAATEDDPFTLAMTTSEARVLSALAEMAENPSDPKSTDDKLMKYLRRMLYITGTVEWAGYRPYDRGVFWEVMGHTHAE